MNKQELASLIWDYCNGLRGSISTVEYKDFILGFIFYRFLSEKETDYLLKQHWTEENMKEYLNTDDTDTVNDCKSSLGYFIQYKDLFSTWKANSDFDISSVSEALERFTRNINNDHLNIFDGIFKSLSDKLPKLGSGNEAKSHIRKIVGIVSRIPMDGRQGYDVLGFIYEYLLANFASNAGKKDGEFYTPHEISLLMSEIVANYLKDRETVNIFDPTSGSGSLLINIGQSIQKYMSTKDNIVYYAQEKIEDTYNLTRMNLIMRGIKPGNIFVRCGDTLKDDWPYIDYNNCYKYVPVDCVVSNPPYSQKWDADDNAQDPRYKHYGIAPSGKADYAFLLHDLYHLKDDGIMCIVLPHGVLFRGGTEKDIRQNLIDKNNIDTIIGLPANIFYGTGIPTIIMVLKKHRTNDDILIIDASKEFYKEGSKNKLAGHNIKKIVDVVLARESVPYFAKKVSKEDIIKNDYNLNIPRYISSSKSETPYDLNATMFGNIPNYEINEFKEFWDAFPSLRNELYEMKNEHISKLIAEDIKKIIYSNKDVAKFINDYKDKFNGIDNEIFELLTKENGQNIYQLKATITSILFDRCKDILLIDKYKVFKAFDDIWASISIDLELIKSSNGYDACREIEDIEVYDKKNKETITKGQQGKVLPFSIIQKILFKVEFLELEELNNRIASLDSEYNACFDELDDENKGEITKTSEDSSGEATIDSAKLKAKYLEIINSLNTDETRTLSKYLECKGKKEKMAYEMAHSDLSWPADGRGKDGTFTKKALTDYVNSLKDTIELNEDEDDYKFRRLYLLSQEISAVKKQAKDLKEELDDRAVRIISTLSDDQILIVLKEKWIKPIVDEIGNITTNLIDEFASQLNKISKKYDNPIVILDNEIKNTESELLSLLEELTGDEYDMDAILALKNLLGGEQNGEK